MRHLVVTLVLMGLLQGCKQGADTALQANAKPAETPAPPKSDPPPSKPKVPLVDAATLQLAAAIGESIALERTKLRELPPEPVAAPDELSSSFTKRRREWSQRSAKAFKDYQSNLKVCIPGGSVVDFPPGSCMDGTLGKRFKALPKGFASNVECYVVDVEESGEGYLRLYCATTDPDKVDFIIVVTAPRSLTLRKGIVVKTKGRANWFEVDDKNPRLVVLSRMAEGSILVESILDPK